MRSKTFLAALVAGALGAPLAALAGDSYGSNASSGGAMSSDTQAQNESCGDSMPKAQCPQSATTPSDESSAQSGSSGDEQLAQGDSSGNDQLARNDTGTDDSLTAEPPNPYGSTGDPNMRNASSST
jgi:hypothetical protein